MSISKPHRSSSYRLMCQSLLAAEYAKRRFEPAERLETPVTDE